MASTLKDLTRMGGDVRKLAKLLQAKAPEGEMLAYINPREAALLKAHGGSGKPEEETGIPSFQDGPSDYESSQMTDDQSVDSTIGDNTITPVTVDFTSAAAPEPSGGSADRAAVFGPVGYGEGIGATPDSAYSLPAREAFDTAMAKQAVTGAPQEAPEKGMSKETMAKLGITGLQGLMGAITARNAAAQGQQAKAETQALAAPYQQKGQEMQAQAQRGELSPQAMQSLQAAQAQAAQGVSARGGVGVAQATAQIEALRQQLLQSQYDYGLKLSGIGDQIALGAIKTGMQADQYANQLTNTYFNNIARNVYSQFETPKQ
jgi:hypothetical protein